MNSERGKATRPIVYYFFAIGTFLLWGTSFAFGKIISPTVSPITITAIRTLIGTISLFLIILISKQLQSWFLIFKTLFWKYVLVGMGLYVFSFILDYWSLERTQSINVAVLSTTMIFWVVGFNLIVFKHRPTIVYIFGLILAMFGVLLILVSEELNFTTATIVGDIATLGTYALWGFYSAIVAKINENVNPLYSTLSTFILASVLLVPLSLILGASSQIVHLSLSQWLSLLYLGVLCGGVAFWMYNKALSSDNISSEYIAIFSLLNPIIGMFSGVMFLNESFTTRQIIGVVLILSSLLLANWNPKKKNEQSKG